MLKASIGSRGNSEWEGAKSILLDFEWCSSFYLDSAFMGFTLYSVIELYVFYALLYVGVTCKVEQNEEVLREKAMRQ